MAEILKILTESILEDEKRLREILNEVRSKSQMRLMSSGHTAAVSRATSYFSDVSYYNEITAGIDYFQSVEQWVREFDSKKGEIIAGLKRVMGALFTRDNMTVSTADDRGFPSFRKP
ncbi:MAG: hypothetical protein ACLVF9_10705 [Enterocloster sp.]